MLTIIAIAWILSVLIAGFTYAYMGGRKRDKHWYVARD